MSVSRTPAVLTGEVTLLGGESAIWTAICDLAARHPEFSFAMIRDAGVKFHPRGLRRYLKRLEIAGYIHVTRPGMRQTSRYRLAKPSAIAPRLGADGRELPEPINETLWRSMKMLRHFDPIELAHAASTELRTVTVSTAGAYIVHLEAVGIIGMIGRDPPGPGHRRGIRRYALSGVLRSGSAPHVLRCHAVFDPGSGQVLGISRREMRV